MDLLTYLNWNSPIGMMIESMAGKAAAMRGTLYDSTPFTYSESDTALEYFGECLKSGKEIHI